MRLFGFFGIPRLGRSDRLANSCGMAVHSHGFWGTFEATRMRISIISMLRIVGVAGCVGKRRAGKVRGWS